MTLKTPLYDEHVNLTAKIVDFAGWSMPIHYGSMLEEHKAVRKTAGMFDVSHMTIIDIHGDDVVNFLRYLLANDIAKLKTNNQALYSVMLNNRGGIIDDLIVYRLQSDFYRLVVNAATREKDLDWLKQYAKDFDINITERVDLAMIAIQGPYAREKTHHAFRNMLQVESLNSLKAFHCYVEQDILVARTGYTGEDGYEVLIPNQQAAELWQKLRAQGIKPCGLGARDTLRLEAGLNLYGQDMDESNHPYESNLGWTIALSENRDFIGRKALEKIKAQNDHDIFVGLVLQTKGIMRAHYPVRWQDKQIGSITSGTFSPTLNTSIALARINRIDAEHCEIGIRGKWSSVKIVKPSFVKHGKILV